MSDSLIKWKFNPPGAPHHGGLQEASVKSVKHHLKRIIAQMCPTIEEINTLLCKIEACSNSRPITTLKNDPENLEILTPSHF